MSKEQRLFDRVFKKKDEGPIKEPLRLDPEDKFSTVDPDLISSGSSANAELTAKAVEAYISVPEATKINIQVSNIEPIKKSCGRIFCAGIDNHVSIKVRRYLQQLGFQIFYPLIDGQGAHGIVEQYQIYSQVDFAIVVLSDDQLMYPKTQDSSRALLVSDQETVFDLGFLVGKLGRNRVAVFYEDIERFKRPTEYFDLLYTAFDEKNLWQEKLFKQLRACGLIADDASFVRV